MAAKFSVECAVCGKKESFLDFKAMQQAHWVALAWEIKENRPVVTCPKCDYPIGVKKEEPKKK